jgi:hypothetical protein
MLPPRTFWLIPAAVVLLRGIPFALTQLAVTPSGSFFPPVGYNPVDSFAYVAFIRQAAETGDWLLSAPYTNLPQSGRFIMPLFALLGHVGRWTGADPFWLLELSRIPLIFLFFAVLWYFCGALLASVRQRFIAAALVAFSGGVEFLFLNNLERWPPRVRTTLAEALSDDQGWNTFASMNNPLWIAGLILTLIALRPLLLPTGEQKPRDWVQFTLAFVAAHLVHPYSGLLVLAVAVLIPVIRWILDVPGGSRRYLVGLCVGLGVSLPVLAAISVWQHQDIVFRRAAENVLGNYTLSVFWYPVTLGALGLLAVRGWRRWIQKGNAGRIELGAWTLVVIFMHSSPVFNGYHFVFHLHVPLCVIAATALDELLPGLRQGAARERLATSLLLVFLFQSPLTVTWRAAKRALTYQVPAPIMSAVSRLAQEPAGLVYTAPHLGTMIPAITHHRVYMGHWFLTPDFSAKQDYFLALADGRANPEGLRDLILNERMDYVLLPSAMPRPVLEVARTLATDVIDTGGAVLLIIRKTNGGR